MSKSFTADGDIYPFRFVKLLGASADGRVLQAGAGEQIFGISQRGTRRLDYIDSSGKAAAAGEPIMVSTLGDHTGLELGGTVARGAKIKADADGKGVNAGTDKDLYGAIALESGVSGEIIRVEVVLGDAAV